MLDDDVGAGPTARAVPPGTGRSVTSIVYVFAVVLPRLDQRVDIFGGVDREIRVGLDAVLGAVEGEDCFEVFADAGLEFVRCAAGEDEAGQNAGGLKPVDGAGDFDPEGFAASDAGRFAVVVGFLIGVGGGDQLCGALGGGPDGPLLGCRVPAADGAEGPADAFEGVVDWCLICAAPGDEVPAGAEFDQAPCGLGGAAPEVWLVAAEVHAQAHAGGDAAEAAQPLRRGAAGDDPVAEFGVPGPD